MENGLISVVVETDKDKTFIIEVPSSIKHKELRELLKNEITKTSHFYFVYKNKRYEEILRNAFMYSYLISLFWAE